ncbi:acetyl-CoA carboxylase biotin carboxylase subunit family protein [Streptomyces misionensis]|uniref:ATP-grasp domain-containing protein n=1 Tax=Streptomyces misionensis TaxID=67331 RepID=UPI0038267A1C
MTVVCLGYRAGFVEAARRRDLDLHFVVDKLKPGLSGLSYTRVADLADAEEVLRAVTEYPGGGISAVVTGHEHPMFAATVLRSVFGLPGDTDPARCLRFRDKRIQKAAVSPAVPTAECVYVKPSDPDYAALAERLGATFVVKPADGFGSQATEAVHDQAELDDYLRRHPFVSDVRTVAESYVEGREIHVDGVWWDGRPVWAAVSSYLDPLMGWTRGKAVADAPLGPAESELADRATRFASDVLRELAAPDTVFHLEAFIRPDGELVLGEVGARPAGALTPEVLRMTHGVDLYGATIDVALGRVPELPGRESEPAELFGWIYLVRSPDPELTEDSFRDRFELVELDYPAPENGRQGIYGRCGHAIVKAATHKELVHELRAIADFNRSA